MSKLSIVVPVFNEEEAIPIFFQAIERVHQNLSEYDFEYWFIDDGSTDQSMSAIKQLQTQSEWVHYVQFSRNFGKEAAIYAGLEHASGDYVALMDVDLQDPPELLPEMLDGVASDEWDMVGSRRINRVGEPPVRTFFSNLFYKLINKISATHLVNGARDYRVMNRQVVNAILSDGEYNRFSKGIVAWVGFRQKYIPFENVERVAGKTSWSFWSLLKYSVEGIVAFSQVPLTVIGILGVVSFITSIIGALLIFLRALLVPHSAVGGWPSLVVIILFMGGIQLLSLGIVGRYVAAIYLETKHRPIYIAREVK
ncbi:glycosyltransferase involved in cell wall biosynthesis [Weissella uvarum]|uniref:glycosyltransferase family 2 protein n=1 Tax=Weissella uvarum TaxID=1479233 RepID=UPI001961685D|nr:glycosyltransferase family 2 protein [Weissella uvarum]MBM7617030.1 glycosyltransferase involved in cell wall biosynthesis [Weissella uvarum]MCM0595328.1 glycosyltransferase family 2 protein [Weissella uvarum]